jgi:two-component system cell cycle response regulator
MARTNETVVTKVDLEDQTKAPAGDSCLVVFYGQNIGRRYFLNKPEIIIGRSDSANIQVDQDSVSRHHVKILTDTSLGQSRIRDLDSTNGTFVNNLRVMEGDLRDGDIVRVGQTIFKHLSGTNIETKYHEEIYRLTTIDGLTEAYNKRFFVDALERELNRAARYGRGISLAMFDIDHFKKVNDTHGHLAGDYVLRELALLVSQNVRRQDILARYGGEEFAVILPEIDAAGSLLVCEKLRYLTEKFPFSYNGTTIQVTISLGIQNFDGAFKGIEDFIAQADAKLYAAKQAGRNRVVA